MLPEELWVCAAAEVTRRRPAAHPERARYMASQASSRRRVTQAWQLCSGAACQARGGPWQARVGLDGAGSPWAGDGERGENVSEARESRWSESVCARLLCVTREPAHSKAKKKKRTSKARLNLILLGNNGRSDSPLTYVQFCTAPRPTRAPLRASCLLESSAGAAARAPQRCSTGTVPGVVELAAPG